MAKVLTASVLSFLLLVGCSNRYIVRDGPQSTHPGDTISGVTAPTLEQPQTDTCGAAQFQSLVGRPSSEAIKLDIPSSSRHYGSEEHVATDNSSRLNFVHSGTAVESVTDPTSTIIRVFCG